MTTPPPLDFDELLDRIGDDKEFAMELLNEFNVDLPANLSAIESALAQGDQEQLVRKSHFLKGAAANLSAKEMSQFAGQVENAGKIGDLALAQQNYALLVTASARFVAAFTEL